MVNRNLQSEEVMKTSVKEERGLSNWDLFKELTIIHYPNGLVRTHDPTGKTRK